MLDALEADLREAAEVGAAGPAADVAPPGWAPPAGLGPLPAEHVEHARRILAAQQNTLGQLDEARASVTKHLAALESVPAARDNGRSIYLDVTG